MSQEVVMHRCKKIDSPITFQELVDSRKNHGRPVWIENGDGSRHLHIFDFDRRYPEEKGKVLNHDDFVRVQKRRAQERARGKTWSGGRRRRMMAQ